MIRLLEVMTIYLALGIVAVSTAWAFIARRGFAGLEQTSSPLARFFATRFSVLTDVDSQTNANMSELNAAPPLATAVMVITMVISFSGKPSLRSAARPLNDNKCQAHSRTCIVEAQIVEAAVYADVR